MGQTAKSLILLKTFLVADTKIKLVLEIFISILSSINIWFAERELVWKIYSTAKELPIIQKVKIVNNKEFAIAAMNKDNKTFIVIYNSH